jgi:multidrug resistance efflux pump
LRTATVRSDIEAQILRLAAQEADASWKQLQEEFELMKRANEMELRVAELALAMEENHLGRHLHDFEQMTIRAPISGLVVLMSQFNNGQFTQVAAGDQVNPGNLFMQIVDLSEMVLTASVNQADTQLVELGQKVTVVVDAYPDLKLEGKIAGVGALAISGGGSSGNWSRGTRPDWMRSVEVRIAISSDDPRILPDLTAAADIVLSEWPGQLIVPRSAIRHNENGEALVQVRDASGFITRKVEIGALTDTQASITAGLSEGEAVAVQWAAAAT